MWACQYWYITMLPYKHKLINYVYLTLHLPRVHHIWILPDCIHSLSIFVFISDIVHSVHSLASQDSAAFVSSVSDLLVNTSSSSGHGCWFYHLKQEKVQQYFRTRVLVLSFETRKVILAMYASAVLVSFSASASSRNMNGHLTVDWMLI